MNGPQAPDVAPIERIQSLDLLRGVALCGILVMNIAAFALPGTSYSNPTAYHNDTISNHLIFTLTHIFFDQKMMGLFSLLFGASAVLFMDKLRLKGMGPTKYYYSRTLWLVVIGILHSIFLWEGDILFFYGICGLFLYFFRWFPPSVNFMLGLTIFLGAIVVGEEAQAWVNGLSPSQLDNLSWAWQPDEREINYEINLRHDSYRELVRYRWQTSEINPTYPTSKITKFFLAQGIMRAFGLMLVGVALYGWNFFRGGNYALVGRVLLLVGVMVSAIGLWLNYQNNWDIHYSLYRGHLYNHAATPIIVLAYALLLVHFANSSTSWIIPWLANYGRMAFSNYLGQSLICTTLFYGYGLGWFALFDRWQLILIVAVILLGQMIFSNLWLYFFHYGPLEWCWRLLTFFRLPKY